MITNLKIIVQTKGSSFVSPAHGWSGARATIQDISAPPPAEKSRAEKQAGKKKKGSGENEFLPACYAARSAAVGWAAARLCVSREAKPAKIDSLIEKEFCARPLKNVSIFAGFAGRRQAASRWAGSAPVRARIVAQKRFERRSVIATIIDFQDFERERKARSAPLARRSARQIPYISALNHTAGEARKGFFCPAGGGSWARSAQSKSNLKGIIERFCSPIFSVCRFAALQSKFLNPALSAPKAQWPKATNLNAL